MFSDLHNDGEVNFEIVQKADIEMSDYTVNAQKRAAADPDNLLPFEQLFDWSKEIVV